MQPGAFRLFLAVLVVLHHCLRVFPVGALAVYTFFMLSGYWVAKMYSEYYSETDYPYMLFIISRVLRLYPLYLLCTGIMLLLDTFVIPSIQPNITPPSLGIKEFACIVLLVPLNLLPFKVLNPAWSLAVEMQFYLIAPVLIVILRRLPTLWSLVILGAVSLFFHVFPFNKSNETVLPYLINFGIGMLIFLKKVRVTKSLVQWSLILIGAVIAVSVGSPELRQALFYHETTSLGFNYYQLFNIALPFLLVPYITHNLRQKSSKLDRQLGDLSYTVYLFHWIALSFYFAAYGTSSYSIVKLIALSWSLIGVIIGSLLIYYLFEKPIEAWRRRLVEELANKAKST